MPNSAPTPPFPDKPVAAVVPPPKPSGSNAATPAPRDSVAVPASASTAAPSTPHYVVEAAPSNGTEEGPKKADVPASASTAAAPVPHYVTEAAPSNGTEEGPKKNETLAPVASGTPVVTLPAVKAEVSGSTKAIVPADQAPVDPSKAAAGAGMVPGGLKAPEPGAKDTAHVAQDIKEEAPEAGEEKPHQLLVTLTLNGEDHGLQFAMMQGKRIWIIASALTDLGATNDNASTAGVKMFRNKAFVDPSVRFPGSTVALSDAQDKLTITLPGSAFGTHRILLNAQQPIVKLTSSPSAFLNYSLGGSDQLTGSAYVDAGISVGTASLRSSSSWAPTQGWRSGPTYLNYDDPKHLNRWTFGDQFVYSTDGTGGGASIAGIGVQRAFDLDPYLITLPQPTISGVLQAPGTIEIYRNGALVGQRAVPAGPFNLEQLGVGIGENNVRVVIRDPFGGTKEISQSFYAVNNNLAKGLSEYAYQLGIASPEPGYIYQTSRPELMMRHRWGLTDSFTFGYRLEAEKGLTNGGLSTDFRLPFGGLHLAGAASQDADHGPGWGANLNYSVSGSRWSLGFGGSKFSNNYRRLGDKLTEDTINKGIRGSLNSYLPIDFGDPLNANVGNPYDPTNPYSPLNPLNPLYGKITIPTAAELLAGTRLKTQVYGTIGYSPLQRLLLQATVSRSSYADGRTDTVNSIGGSYDLSWASIYFGYDKSNVQLHKDRTITASITIPLGMQTVTFNRITRNDGSVSSVDVQRSLPGGTGVGYNFHAEDAASGKSESLDISAQNRFLRANAQIYNSPIGRSENLQLAGSLVFIDKELHFGQPLSGNGYALINVGDGLKGVPVIRENQEVGKTGRSGSFLVNDLLPYQNNTVGFDQKGVPPSYAFKEVQRTINVPRSGGTVVNFNVHKLRAGRGKLHVGDTVLNSGTIVKLVSEARKGKPRKEDALEAPLGTKGNFFLEDMPEGRYEIQAAYEGRLAKCPVIVPATDAPIYDLKSIACTWDTSTPASEAPGPSEKASKPVHEAVPGNPDGPPTDDANGKSAPSRSSNADGPPTDDANGTPAPSSNADGPPTDDANGIQGTKAAPVNAPAASKNDTETTSEAPVPASTHAVIPRSASAAALAKLPLPKRATTAPVSSSSAAAAPSSSNTMPAPSSATGK